MPLHVFLRSATGENQMTAVGDILRPAANEILIDKLIGRRNDKWIFAEITIRRQYIHGRHHTLERSIVFQPVGKRVPPHSLFVVFDIPAIVKRDKESGAAAGE